VAACPSMSGASVHVSSITEPLRVDGRVPPVLILHLRCTYASVAVEAQETRLPLCPHCWLVLHPALLVVHGIKLCGAHNAIRVHRIHIHITSDCQWWFFVSLAQCCCAFPLLTAVTHQLPFDQLEVVICPAASCFCCSKQPCSFNAL
jgi:hypothetical protein